MISLLNVARPIAMKALQNPKILGSLLVGSVGAQQANEIQNQLSLGNISLDDVYDTLINFASSPAVSIINEMQTTPAGEVYAPKESEIEAEKKFNEELNKKITTASETPIADILITPDVQEKFEPLITLPPEFKLDQEGFTPAPEVKPSDYIMKSEEKKTDLKPNEKIFNQIAGVKNHTVERDPNDLFLEGWEKMIFPSPKQIGSIGNYAVAIDPMKRSDNNFLLVKDGKVHATLELATAMGQDKVLELDAIGVPAEMQGQGIAKDVLNELFKLADANGVTIQGVAQPFGNKALNKKQLISFYKNMGFTVDGDNIERKPVIAEEKSSLVPPIDFSIIPENTPISVKPVPKKVAVDKGLSENEGVYMANVDGQNVDLKNKTFNTANISVTPDGIPKFDVQNAINRDIEKVPGSKLTKVNLFKKSAGWKWLDKPEGGNDSFLVSVEQGGKHYYTLDTNMTADTQLKYYPNEKSEPRLRPTAYDDLILGNKVGEIDVRGKKHPVYDSIEVSSPKQAVGADVTEKTISPKEYTPKMKTDIPYDYVEAVNPTKVFGEQDLRKEKYLDKTADPINYSFTSNDLDQIKSKVFKEYKDKTGVDIEKIANNFGFKMPDLDLLNNSLNRDEKARYWWQQSAEWLDGLMDQLDLTKDEKNLFLEVLSTTSGGVDPAQNLKIALGVFSDMLSNRPIRMGFKTAQSLDVLLKDKESKINSPKFRNYVDSFKYFAGTDDRIPNTTIDLQMSKIFGMNPEALAGNPDLYSLVTMVVNDLTNEVNKSIPKGEELLQPFELQAMMWTENRGGRSTNFSEVGPQVLMQMENLGYSINREDIKDINFVRDLQSTVRPFEESIKMTVESGTFSTPQGNKIEQIINSFPDDKVLMDKINQVNKSTNLSLISKSKKNPSIIEDLVSAVVGEKAEMSRLIQGFGTSEGQVGNNIIIPSVYKNNKGQMIQLSDQQRLFILSTLGKYLDQNSVSSSNFILVDDSLQIPQGTKPTTSYYVPSTKYNQKQLQELTKTSGYDFNITPVTGGFVLNTLSSQGKPDNNKIISSLENIFGKEINVGVLDTVWYGDLIERNSYEENINAFLQNDKRTDKKSGDTQSVFNDIFSKIKAISNKRDQKYQEILDSTKVINLLKKSKIELKRRGGIISVPKIPSLVNGGLVDINTIIGKINYGN